MIKNNDNVMRLGFTILEFVISTFIIISIVAVVSVLVMYSLNSYTFSIDENQAITQTQYGLTRIITHIREARTAETGAWPIEQADDNALVVFTDVTGDSKTDRVRFFIDGTTLKQGVIEPMGLPPIYPLDQEKITILASSIDNANQPLFTYYNGDWPVATQGNPLAASDRILKTRYIFISLRIHPNPNTNTQPYQLQSGVEIRSLKDNL